MAMGRQKKQQAQQQFWIPTRAIPKSPGHPLYERLNQILEKDGFDDFVEESCAQFYAEKIGRPSLAPGIYFRLLMIGYFEGIDSERGIAWRVADSISLRAFLRLEFTDPTPDHSTFSRTRRLIDLGTHELVSARVSKILARAGLLKAKTLGVVGTALEANAAMRSIVRRDDGKSYPDYVKDLAKDDGNENPTREEIARFDRKRKKKTSNKEWEHPHDPDARVTRMKDGRTHMAHKVEHVVDMETGAILSVTLHPADRGDTASLARTLEDAKACLEEIIDDPEASKNLSDKAMSELVADKGYHSNAVMVAQKEDGIRTYISEPDRGRRNWKDKEEERLAVTANRRRIRGTRGRKLMRDRGEKIERSFAHCYDTGGMRRTHLRGHENIGKRLLIHVAAFNLGLILRRDFGVGTPRGLQGLSRALQDLYLALNGLRNRVWRLIWHLQVPDLRSAQGIRYFWSAKFAGVA